MPCTDHLASYHGTGDYSGLFPFQNLLFLIRPTWDENRTECGQTGRIVGLLFFISVRFCDYFFPTLVSLNIILPHKLLCSVSWYGNSATIPYLKSRLSIVCIISPCYATCYSFRAAQVCASGSRQLITAAVSADTCGKLIRTLSMICFE